MSAPLVEFKFVCPVVHRLLHLQPRVSRSKDVPTPGSQNRAACTHHAPIMPQHPASGIRIIRAIRQDDLRTTSGPTCGHWRRARSNLAQGRSPSLSCSGPGMPFAAAAEFVRGPGSSRSSGPRRLSRLLIVDNVGHAIVPARATALNSEARPARKHADVDNADAEPPPATAPTLHGAHDRFAPGVGPPRAIASATFRYSRASSTAATVADECSVAKAGAARRCGGATEAIARDRGSRRLASGHRLTLHGCKASRRRRGSCGARLRARCVGALHCPAADGRTGKRVAVPHPSTLSV